MSAALKKIISIYKNVHFQSLFGNGVMAAVGMLSLAILYRTLSLADIGIYIFVLTVNGLMDTFRSGFLTITFVKFYSGTGEERAREVAGSAWFLAIASTAIAVIINIPSYFAANYFSDQSVVISLKYFCVLPVISLPSFMANCVLQSYKRFDQLLVLRILNQGSFAVVVAILAYLHMITLTSVLLTFAGCNLLCSVCVLLFKWTKILTLKYANRPTIMELFHFGKYAMGTNISVSLFGVINTFIITFLIGPVALATYNLSGKLLQIIEIPLLSFAASGMPILSAQYNRGEKEELMYTLKKMVGMLTVLLVPVVIIAFIFAEPIIYLLGGKAYVNTEAPNLFRMIMVMSLLWPADRFFALVLDVIHLPKVNFYKILVMLLVNVVAIFVGCAIYKSIYTITLATLIPSAVAIIMSYYPLNNFYKFNYWNMYVVGFKEDIILIKGFLQTTFKR